MIFKNYEIIKLLSGYTIVSILCKNALVEAQFGCKTDTLDGILVVNCSGVAVGTTILENVPDNLDEKAEYLDLSENTFRQLTENAFKRYENLIGLRMHNSKTSSFVDNYLFRPLVKLENLDVSGIRFKGSKITFFWPPNLKKLNIRDTEIKDLNCADLTKLETVDASMNVDMLIFPQFNVRAPLHSVNLDGNLMNALDVEQLAQYCNIKNLGLNVVPQSELLNPAKYCDCTRLNLWMSQFAIRTNSLKCTIKVITPKNIGKPIRRKRIADDKCDTNFGDHILVKRRECLETEARSYTFVLIAVAAFIGLLTLITLIFAYRYVNLRRHVHPTDSEDSGAENADEDDDE